MNEISYNRERFNEVCKECNLTPYRIWKDIHTGNQITPRRWIDGGDIPVSRLIDFCNFYHIDILSFFLLHDERLDDAMKELNSTQEERGSDSFADERINHVKEISELEKTHIKELAEKEIECVRKIGEMRENIRREMKSEFNQDREEITTKYEKKLEQKDSEIVELRQKLVELQTQYKELELYAMRNGANIPLSKLAVSEKGIVGYQK